MKKRKKEREENSKGKKREESCNIQKERKKLSEGLTIARLLFKPRKTSCLLMDRSLAMSLGSNRAYSTTSTT